MTIRPSAETYQQLDEAIRLRKEEDEARRILELTPEKQILSTIRRVHETAAKVAGYGGREGNLLISPWGTVSTEDDKVVEAQLITYAYPWTTYGGSEKRWGVALGNELVAERTVVRLRARDSVRETVTSNPETVLTLNSNADEVNIKRGDHIVEFSDEPDSEWAEIKAFADELCNAQYKNHFGARVDLPQQPEPRPQLRMTR